MIDTIQKTYAWLLAALISITIAVVNNWVQKRRATRSITYRVLTNTPLVNRAPSTAGQLTVAYNGKDVADVRLIEVQFQNTGGQSLSPTEFHEPIELRFAGSGVELFEPGVTLTSPEEFKPEVELIGASIRIKPTLMNIGDRMVVKVLAAGYGERDPTIVGRVEGVTRFKAIGKIAEDDYINQWLSVRISGVIIVVIMVAYLLAAGLWRIASLLGLHITAHRTFGTISVIASALILSFFLYHGTKGSIYLFRRWLAFRSRQPDILN